MVNSVSDQIACSWPLLMAGEVRGGAQEEASVCAICLSELNPPVSGRVKLLSLSCGHSFHLPCLTQAFSTNRQNMRCPLCRFNVTLDKELKDLEDRIFFYEAALEKYETDAVAHHNLGLTIKQQLGRVNHKAFQHLVRAVEIKPRWIECWHTLADNWHDGVEVTAIRLQGTSKQFKRIDCYQKILALDPGNQKAADWVKVLVRS